jgi:hypothetical protein
MIRYCECRTHADGREVCGRQASVKITFRRSTGVQGPFFYCSDCVGGLTGWGVTVEKLADPNAPTDPAPALGSEPGYTMHPPEQQAEIDALIARSSLGTPEAVAARLAADERAVERALARAEELDAELREDDEEEPV